MPTGAVPAFIFLLKALVKNAGVFLDGTPTRQPGCRRYPFVSLFLRETQEIREFKHDVYGRPQTAEITSDFLFFSCNP